MSLLLSDQESIHRLHQSLNDEYNRFNNFCPSGDSNVDQRIIDAIILRIKSIEGELSAHLLSVRKCVNEAPQSCS